MQAHPGRRRARLGEVSGSAMRALVARRPIVLLPFGSLEDQGPHAPVGDYLLAERLSELIAEHATAAGAETYVAPALPFGGDDYCGTSPGGITLSQATLAAVVSDMVASLTRNGLGRIVAVNGHGGNVAVLQDVLRRRYRATGQMVPCINLWRTAHALLPEAVGPEAASATLGHGADPLTSVAMHLFPHLVAAAELRAPSAPAPVLGLPMRSFTNADFGKLDVQLPVDYDALVPDAIWSGDPRLASAETGKALVERLVALCGRFICHFHERSSGEPSAP